MPAVELAGLFGPQFFHGFDGLAGIADPLREVQTEKLGLLAKPSGADAEQEPTVAEVVQCGDLLGQQYGLRSGTRQMPVPSLRVDVTADARPKATKGSTHS